jgi:hypothetical protein
MLALAITVILFAAVLLELWAGTNGCCLPAVALAGFYATVAWGWRASFVPLLLTAVILDATLGRRFPVSALLLAPAVLFLARFWRRKGNCRQLSVQWVPGALVGFIQGALLLASEGLLVERLFWRLAVQDAWYWAQYTVTGALLLGAACAVLDRIARALNLPVYLEPSAGRLKAHAS